MQKLKTDRETDGHEHRQIDRQRERQLARLVER